MPAVGAAEEFSVVEVDADGARDVAGSGFTARGREGCAIGDADLADASGGADGVVKWSPAAIAEGFVSAGTGGRFCGSIRALSHKVELSTTKRSRTKKVVRAKA
jgi:hypothetical protein